MSNIEWTDVTWNPVRGCEKVSPGCRNCYAMHMSNRLGNNPKIWHKYKGLTEKTQGGQTQWTGMIETDTNELEKPLKLKKPRRIFVCSMSDLFNPKVSSTFIAKVFAVMAACPQHQFQILTKRPDIMRNLLTIGHFLNEVRHCFETNQIRGNIDNSISFPGWPLPNVLLGTSVEDQKRAEERIPYLIDTPAAIRFLSCEPLLGPVNIKATLPFDILWIGFKNQHDEGIDWVIAGGESGSHARPVHPAWLRSLRDQCDEAGVAFFFKQWGEWVYTELQTDYPKAKREYIPEHGITYKKVGKHEGGNLLDGRKHEEYPKAKEVTYDND